MRRIRREHLRRYVNAEQCRILEIGALDYPTFAPPDYNAKFVDYVSTEELAKKGESNPRYKREFLAEVDFVCPTPIYSRVIDEEFDLVVANHVIEHIPDTIRWLEELASVMAPGGHLFLSIPDKRYTFDIARRNTNFIDLLRNYEEEIKKPHVYQILEHFYFHKTVSAADAWTGKHKEKLSQMRYSTEEALRVARHHAGATYADVHCHVFTSDSFLDVIRPLIDLGKVPFHLVSSGETAKMTNEFHVVFRRQ